MDASRACGSGDGPGGTRLDIRHLEIHVAHACNLRCESCSHYSDYGHKGIVSLDEADDWMGGWSRRLRPATFSLVGGEPAVHPRLADFVRLARGHWPDSHLRLVTNGFLLHKHPDLPLALKDDPNARIYLSIHHQSPEYLEELRPNLELLRKWEREHRLRISIYRSFADWRRTYLGRGPGMQPYDDRQPRKSWQNCAARYCPQLFEARIWKCSPLAYLRMQNRKVALSEAWNPYLAYEPLPQDCSDDRMREFFAQEDEPHCGMCPAAPERFAMPLPLVRKASRQPDHVTSA